MVGMGNLTKFKHDPPLFDLYTSQKVGSKKILMKQHDKNYKSHAFNEMGNCEKWGVKVGIGGEMTQKRRDRTQPKYKALDMTEHALKVAIRTIDRHAGEGYAKEHQTKDPHPWHHGRFVCLVTLTAMCIRIFCL